MMSWAEKRYLEDLNNLKKRLKMGRLKNLNKIQQALGRLLERHPHVTRYYSVHLDEKPLCLSWSKLDEKDEASFLSSGHYYLRSSRKDLDDQTIWNMLL